MNHRRIVQVSLGIRIGIAVLTRTVFQPDEYFQSLEPAFRVVFGHGHLTWEWLSQNPIRSIIYPALNIPVYWLLKATGLAHTGWVGDWLLVGVSFSTFLPILTRSDTTSQSLAWYIWSSHGHLAMWIGAGDVGKRLCFDCGTLQKFLPGAVWSMGSSSYRCHPSSMHCLYQGRCPTRLKHPYPPWHSPTIPGM